MAFTEEEVSSGLKLLEHVKEEQGYWPDQLLDSVREIEPGVAPELFMPVPGLSPKMVLKRYDGGKGMPWAKVWDGKWHMPGGFRKAMKPAHATLPGLVSEIGRREYYVDVAVVDTHGHYLWAREEHANPTWTPLSIYVEVVPLTPIVESDELRVFSLDDLPPDDEIIGGSHRWFIKQYLSGEHRCPECRLRGWTL